MIIGRDGLSKLKQKRVAVIGIGGVGSWAAEALVRAGIGSIVIVDTDIIVPSNINRQIIALHSTLGESKVKVMARRLMDINPEVEVTTFHEFYDASSSQKLLSRNIDYVVDAIDSMKSKIHLVYTCKQLGLPIISSMGAGNKLDPTAFKITDLSKTSVCPVARIMRRELRKLGINKGVKVVFSDEPPKKIVGDDILSRSTPGSISFVPPVAGLLIASEVVKDLLEN